VSDPKERARKTIADTLVGLDKKLFCDGAMLTFIARFPGKPDQTMIVTADNLDEIVAAIRHIQSDLRTIRAPGVFDGN
jgi:hypothetical protein